MNTTTNIIPAVLLSWATFTHASPIILEDFSQQGWHNPVDGMLVSDSNYTYDSASYFGGRYSHKGVDIETLLGTPVYAIGDGTVYVRKLHCNGNGDEDPSRYNVSVIFAEHTSDDGLSFTAVYGHVKPIYMGDRKDSFVNE